MQLAQPDSPDLTHRTLANAAETARGTLARLFAPSNVRLVETRVGAPGAADVPADVQVDFEIGGPMHARMLVASGGFDSMRLANGLLGRGDALTGLDSDAREALAEMANIAASSFLNHLAKLAKVRLVPSVPRLREQPLHPPRAPRPVLMVIARYAVDFGAGVAEFMLVAEPEVEFMTAMVQQEQ